MAPHEALGIPEMLEEILLEVDMRTLLTSAQRVSQWWRDVITDSPRIQQRLFLRPITENSRPECNPLTADILRCILREKRLWLYRMAGNYTYDDPPGRVAAFRDPNAVWRRMLLQQPVVHSAHTRYTLDHGLANEWYTVIEIALRGCGRLRFRDLDVQVHRPLAKTTFTTIDAFPTNPAAQGTVLRGSVTHNSRRVTIVVKGIVRGKMCVSSD